MSTEYPPEIAHALDQLDRMQATEKVLRENRRACSALVWVLGHGTVYASSMLNGALEVLREQGLVEGNQFISASAFGYMMRHNAEAITPPVDHPTGWQLEPKHSLIRDMT